MKAKSKDNVVISSLLFSILALGAYKLFYGVNMQLFWVAFVCERLYSLGAKEDFDRCLDDLDYDEDNKKILIKIIGLIVIIIGIFIYITFTETKILIYIAIGEVVDIIIQKPYKKLINKDN